MSRELKQFDNTADLAAWYDAKYTEMGDGWYTPPEECNRHLDAMGVPFDKNKKLLDIGCGAGHFLSEAEKRVSCVGVEISNVGIKHAIVRAPSSVFYELSIEHPDLSRLGGYDYIVSIGSLEHVVHIGKALDNIRKLLKDDGTFYFYCPNELWKHFDQPNERTKTDKEWFDLFWKHDLYVYSSQRWNDNTAFIGAKYAGAYDLIPPAGNKLNIGSGQRRFECSQGWVNIDCVSRKGQIPDLILNVGKEKLPYGDGSMDVCVLHHVLEHFGLGEGQSLITECQRVLKAGGSLIVTVPDMEKLAKGWLDGTFSDYIYMVNVYGAYMGEPGDRHCWGFRERTLMEEIARGGRWRSIEAFNWRQVPGADIARDDRWILGVEAFK